MTVLKSAIDTRSATFAANSDSMRGLVADLHATVSQIKQGGGTKARERHLSRGKLLPARPRAHTA